MKQNLLSKLLLLTAIILFGATGAFAADETITFSEQGYTNQQAITTVEGDDFTITFDKGNNANAPKYYTTGAAIRVYGGGTMTVSSDTKTITKIELTFGSGDGTNAITTEDEAYDNGVWEGSASSVVFAVGGTSGHRRIASVAVTYAASTSSVAAPTLPASCDFTGSMEVEITNNENGATVYYTTDEGASLTEYTEPFTITETTTVTAYAEKDGDLSDEVTRTYTKVVPPVAELTGITPNTVDAGEAGQFALEGTFATENYTVLWESSDENVLYVDPDTGEFLAGDSRGTVTITVLVGSNDGSYEDVTGEFAVTVTAPMTFETVTLPYEESFAGTFGKFQSDGVKAGTTDVWTATAGSDYVKGTAYFSGTRYPCTSYLYSPILDLSNETTATLTFSHVGRYFGTPADEAKLVVRQKDGDLWGEWEPLTIENFTNSSSWTFTDATIDLSAYAGQQVQLAFVYICPSTSTAGTWEIKDLAVTNVVQKIDIATLNGITPTEVEVDAQGTFTLDATFAEGTVAGEDYEVIWSSDNDDVLLVDESTGEYVAGVAGTANVTVSIVPDDTKYNEVSETFAVTVKEPFLATAYELVTDASTLADGDEIIIAYVNADEETAVAMGAQRDNNRGAVGVQVNSDGILVNNEDVQLITLEKDEEGFFYFNVGNGYLYAAGGSSGNYLKTEETLDEQDRAKATISITEGSAEIKFQTTQTTRRLLKYNNSGTSNLFSCYASGQNEPQIYRKAEPVTVTIGQHGYATYCGDKNLDFAAAKTVAGADATINVYAVTEVNNGYMGMTQFDGNMYVAEHGAIMKAEADTYVVPVAITDGEMAGNLLVGNATQEAITVPGGTNVYRFGYSPAAGKVGFMQSSSDFTVGAGKAYLQVPEQMNAAEFLSFDGEATGISTAEVETTDSDAVRYNLAGQRVNSNYRGVVIVDGKKLIQK